MKKIVSIVLALAMILMVGAAFAATSDPSITINPINPTDVENVEIGYIAYRILEADIDKDPAVGLNGSTSTPGQVAYYVTTADRAAELEETGLFEISKVDGANKWYVALKDKTTDADDLVTAFSKSTFDLSVFPQVTFSKAATATNAISGDVNPGYYYITSTLGSKIALQTLTKVTINEKNEYSTAKKTIPEDDENSELGQPITYTLTVDVPASANQEIVLTDTMSKGLTFDKIESDSGNGTLSYDDTPDSNGATKFTITYSAAQVKDIAASTKKITVLVTVKVNKDAIVETNIPNTLKLEYGNVYNATPKTVNTKTYSASFDKVDKEEGGTKLPNAEFKLTKNADNTKDSTDGWMDLVVVEAGKTYRLATEDDTTKTDTIVTNGNTVTINGLDLDNTYYLVETKEPTGFNILTEHVELKKNSTSFIHANIVNQKGATLPSTGGIGTTIFYILGGVLVIGAAVILIARRKAHD